MNGALPTTWDDEWFSITMMITWRMTGRACTACPHADGAATALAWAGRATVVAIAARAPATAARRLIGRGRYRVRSCRA